jgi:hypothetical protein
LMVREPAEPAAKAVGRLLLAETRQILTHAAEYLVRPIHDRMPVILQRNDYAKWLDSRSPGCSGTARVIGPVSAEEMKTYPVSTLVNKPQNNGPECLEPVEIERAPSSAEGAFLSAAVLYYVMRILATRIVGTHDKWPAISPSLAPHKWSATTRAYAETWTRARNSQRSRLGRRLRRICQRTTFLPGSTTARTAAPSAAT